MARSRVLSTSRKSTPTSPPKAPLTRAAPDASNHNKRKTRAASREITSAQQQLQHIETVLQPVIEHEEESLPGNIGDAAEVSSLLDVSSTGSSIQEILDALDRDAIIDNLQNLYDDSVSLIALFEDLDDEALENVCDHAMLAMTRTYKRLQNQTKRLLATRESYSTNLDGGKSDFIKADLILHKLLGVPEGEGFASGPWRPDAVLSLANLALQMVKVLSYSPDERMDYLHHLFRSFPEQFIINFQPTLETYEGAYDVHIEVLTQFYLSKVKSKLEEPDFDPDNLLAEVLFDEEGRVKESSDPDAKSKALERREFIRQYFGKDSGSFIDFKGLQAEFPWRRLTITVVRWTLALKKELESSVDSNGGIQRMTELLLAGKFEDGAVEEYELAIARRKYRSGQEHSTGGNSHGEENANTINMRQTGQQHDSGTGEVEETHSGAAADRPMKGNRLNSNLKGLKAVKSKFVARNSGISHHVVDQSESDSESHREDPNSQMPANDQEPRSMDVDKVPMPPADKQREPLGDQEPQHLGDKDAQPLLDDEPPQLEDEGPQPLEDEEPQLLEDDDIVATQQAKTVIEAIHRQKQQSNKENSSALAKKPSFLDRQEGAHRVGWDNNFPNDDVVLRRTRQSPKRSRRQADHNSGEDEFEFEKDIRAAKRPRVAGGGSIKSVPAPTGPEDMEEDTEETTGEPSTRREPQTLASRPRTSVADSAAKEPRSSPQGRRRAVPSSSSQPADTDTRESPARRAPLQQISPRSRALPSSSAPPRPDPATKSSAHPPRDRLPPSFQEPRRSESRQPSQSQEPPSTQVRQANQQAKERVQMARDLMQNRRPAQSRIPYSVDEVDRLMEMIAMYDTQWSRILREDRSHEHGPRLQQRTQVQLKDKARNIKIDWLKSGKRLERGFEAVSVGPSKIEELRLLGIDYFEGEGAARYVGQRAGSYDEDDIDD